MGQTYRVNFTDSPATTMLTPQFIGLSVPTEVNVIRALQGAGLIKAYDQVEEVTIHDSLPSRWPDHISVLYHVESGPVRILLIRLRKDCF